MKRNDIISLMPSIFQRSIAVDDSLSALVDGMEHFHEPSEKALDQLEMAFNPQRNSDEMVPFMSQWVDLDWLWNKDGKRLKRQLENNDLSLKALRELLIKSFELAKWRGTLRGLVSFLETATEVEGYKIQENISSDGHYKSFHLLVTAPEEAESKKEIIDHIVRNEKAAYLSHEIVFGDERKGLSNGR